MSTTGTTLASFQKVYFETNATMTLRDRLALDQNVPPLPARFDTNAWTVKPSSGFHLLNAVKSAPEPVKFCSWVSPAVRTVYSMMYFKVSSHEKLNQIILVYPAAASQSSVEHQLMKCF